MIERKTVIDSNGSKWAGEPPDPIEKLYEVLQTHTLNPVFEKYGDFCFWAPDSPDQPAMIRFWGNFYALSHVFAIDTNEPAVIERLTTLISNNKSTPAYQEAKRELREHELQEERKNEQRERLRRQGRQWRAR
jgi:hypothetical protein